MIKKSVGTLSYPIQRYRQYPYHEIRKAHAMRERFTYYPRDTKLLADF